MQIQIGWIFNFVSSITVPPISFIFPPLLYYKLINEDHFKIKWLHYTIFAMTLLSGIIIWIVSIFCLYYTEFSHK